MKILTCNFNLYDLHQSIYLIDEETDTIGATYGYNNLVNTSLTGILLKVVPAAIPPKAFTVAISLE